MPTTLFGGAGAGDIFPEAVEMISSTTKSSANPSRPEEAGTNWYISPPPRKVTLCGIPRHPPYYFSYSNGSQGYIGPLNPFLEQMMPLTSSRLGSEASVRTAATFPRAPVNPWSRPRSQALTPGVVEFRVERFDIVLSLQVSDPNTNATSEVRRWTGEIIPSAGTDMGGAVGSHTLTAAHIFALYGTYTVTATVIDSHSRPGSMS